MIVLKRHTQKSQMTNDPRSVWPYPDVICSVIVGVKWVT